MVTWYSLQWHSKKILTDHRSTGNDGKLRQFSFFTAFFFLWNRSRQAWNRRASLVDSKKKNIVERHTSLPISFERDKRRKKKLFFLCGVFSRHLLWDNTPTENYQHPRSPLPPPPPPTTNCFWWLLQMCLTENEIFELGTVLACRQKFAKGGLGPCAIWKKLLLKSITFERKKKTDWIRHWWGVAKRKTFWTWLGGGGERLSGKNTTPGLLADTLVDCEAQSCMILWRSVPVLFGLVVSLFNTAKNCEYSL